MSADIAARLLNGVATGDASAFETLYTVTCAKMYGTVARIIRRRTPKSIELMADIYLDFWKRSGQFVSSGQTSLGWMSTIARRHAVAFARDPSEIGATGSEIIE